MEYPEEVQAGVSALLQSQTFFASLMFGKMVLVYDESVPTAATDGRKIMVGRWFCQRTVPERVFILCHEVCHAIFDHCSRAKLYMDTGLGPDMKEFDSKKWNVCADWIINSLLKESGVGVMPAEGLLNNGVTGDDLLDEVYAKTILPDDDGPKGGEGSSHGGFDEHMEAPAPITEAQKADMERAVLTAANTAKAQGKLPAGLARLVDSILHPKVNWQNVIRQEIINRLTVSEMDWSRPNRRKQVFSAVTGLDQPVYPSDMGRSAGVMVIQCDTSGSIGNPEIKAMLGGIKDIAEDCPPEELYVLWTDHVVAHVDHYEDDIVNELDLLIERVGREGAPGGGGTNMGAGFHYIEDLGIYPDVMVTFTDGYTPWPSECSFSHVTACTVERKVDGCPFGQSVFCDVDTAE